MQKILVISDIHMCGAGQTIIELDPLARFQQVLTAACDAHPDAAALILLGDLTHHGLPDEYTRLADALRDCPIPVIPMLGNHDRRGAFLGAFPDAPQSESGHVQKVLDLDHHRIITLDTLDGPPYPKGHHAGRLCTDRIAFLQGALATRKDKVPLVFMHHPPFETGIVGMDAIRLADGQAVLDMLRENGPLHLFCGHIHRTISGMTHGVPWTIFKSPCHQGVIDLEASDSSLSIDEPGAYGLVLSQDAAIITHTQDVSTDLQGVSRDIDSTSAT